MAMGAPKMATTRPAREILAKPSKQRQLAAMVRDEVIRCLTTVEPGLEGGDAINESDAWYIAGKVAARIVESDICRRGR